MQPIAQLAGYARGLRGVFTDIDDTLTHSGALVPAAYSKLCELKAAGLRVVPVTGRPAGYAAVLAAMWPVDAVVAENGAVAYVRGRAEPIYWEADAAARARDRDRLALLRDSILRDLNWAHLAEDNWLRICDIAFDIGEKQHLAIEQRNELVARIQSFGARSTVSTVHAHAFYGDWDKARMLIRLAKVLWNDDLEQDREKYLFVGDSPNDAAGFDYFPISAGVANVKRYSAILKTPPKFVAANEGGFGFSEIADVILKV